jgi:hypothetical protein
MIKPQRIQRRRTRGYNMQAESHALNGLECVSVARPGRWGNPFRVGVDGDAAECVRKYSEMLLPYRHHGKNSGMEKFFLSEANLEMIRSELGGKNLACFCRIGDVCHGDLLLKLASEQ